MKKIVLYGDGLLCPPHGFGEYFADLLALRQPGLAFQVFHAGTEFLEMESALKNAALHVIGKAPDLVFLTLGHADLIKKTGTDRIMSWMGELLNLLSAKTGAKICYTSACTAFLPDELRTSADAFNSALAGLQDARRIHLDLNGSVSGFLEKHRKGAGEKRALHQSPLRLTSMGRTLLAHAALDVLTGRGLLND